jgi:hypothetical protein
MFVVSVDRRSVVVVLRLLRHREGARHGHLDRPVRVDTQEADVLDLHRVLAPDGPDDAPRTKTR